MTRRKPTPDSIPDLALEAALAASRGVGAWAWDIASDRASADPVVALLFNIDPDRSRAGVPFSEIAAAIHPEDRALISDIIWQAARAGGSYVAEYRVVSPHRRIRWVLSRGCFRCDASGEPIEGRGVALDVTDSHLGGQAFAIPTPDAAATLLELAADQCIALHRSVTRLEDPEFEAMTKALLVAFARRLARQQQSASRKRLH
ncbi:PAS domain-containing protein [Methylobacterium sp. A54F]